MMHTILKRFVRDLKAMILPSWTGAKKTVATVLAGTLMYTTLASPLVEAGFWQDRQKAAQSKNSSGAGAQYAMAPAGALTDALPFLDGKSQSGVDLESLSGSGLLSVHSSLSPEQLKSLPAWLNHISSAHGTISQAYFAPNAADRPLIVHIQDVHEQREAQMNISGLINEIVGTGAVSLVGLEGATGAFDLTPYRTFPNKAVIGDVADFLVQEHMIGGGEHAGWTAEKTPTLWGVEEVGVYLKNLNSFKEALPIQQRVQDRIKSWEFRLAQVKPKAFSPELKAFDESQARYKSGTLALPEYVDLLEKTVKLDATKFPGMAAFRHCLSMEKSLNFADVEKERTHLIESLTKALSEKEIASLVQRTLLYRSGRLSYGAYYDSLQTVCEAKGVSLSRFPAMAAYIKYVLASEQIKPEALLTELEVVQEMAAASLVRTPEERAIYDLAQDLHSLTNLAAFKMAPHDWATYQQSRSRIMDMAARMDRLAPGADNYAGDLPKDLVPFEGFCQAALARDRTLTDNLLAKMKESGQKNAVLLTGGFHTEGMTDLLRKEKVSYVVFTPALTEVSADSNYLDFLKDRPALEKLFTQEKITTKAPILGSVVEATPGYTSEGVKAAVEAVITSEVDGQVTDAVKAMSPAVVTRATPIDGVAVYAVETGGKNISVAVSDGQTPPTLSVLGQLVARFSGKVKSFSIYAKENRVFAFLSPTVIMAKVAGFFSSKKGVEGDLSSGETRNFLKMGQLAVSLTVVAGVSLSLFGVSLAALGSFLGFGLLGILLHELGGHLLVYSSLGGKGGQLLFGKEGIWVKTGDLGLRKNAWVAIAGPAANILMAAVAGLLLWAGVDSSALQAFAATNLVFGVTALLPIGRGSDIENFFSFRQKEEDLENYAADPVPVLLETPIQNYLWGQKGEQAYIPRLLGIPAGSKQYAEVWIGAHPDLPSTAVLPTPTGNKIKMDRLVEGVGEKIMSPHARELYNGQLPFLFKVLAAGKPLSIQVHPNKEQAEAGFARENQAGIDLKAENRNYKDPNHKPELIAAVTEFFGLRGFKPLEEIATAFKANEELMGIAGATAFVSDPTEKNLEILYGTIMGLPEEQVDTILSPLIERLARQNEQSPFPKTSPEYWVLRSDSEFLKEGHHDRGVFSVYLLNLIRLNPGQAMYLSAGVPHAYLDGVGMEIMANSNNVLRGGLTPRHVDVPELMNTVVFQGESPAVRDGIKVSRTETVYREAGDVPEFQLSRIAISQENMHIQSPLHDVETLIVLEAEHPLVLRMDDSSQLTLTRGQTVMIPRGIGYRLLASKGPATLYKATVPMAPIAMGGMASEDKAIKVAEFVSDLRNLKGKDADVVAKGVRAVVDRLFQLQRDGDLGDVNDIADMVDRTLHGNTSDKDIHRFFSSAFTARYQQERSRHLMSQASMKEKAAELVGALGQSEGKTEKISAVVDDLLRIDYRFGWEIFEFMIPLFEHQNTPAMAGIGVQFLQLLENRIIGATFRGFSVSKIQSLRRELDLVSEGKPGDASPLATGASPLPSKPFQTIKGHVTVDAVVNEINARLKEISADRFLAAVPDNGLIRGPGNRAEAVAKLRGQLNTDLSTLHTAIADSTMGLSETDLRYVLRLQTLVMDALLIVDLLERGIPGAMEMRLTTIPGRQLSADGRAECFIEAATLSVRQVNQENDPGAYNRGIEPGTKMKGDLADVSGHVPQNLEAYVLYTMRHGLVPVPEGLGGVTKAKGGAVSTFHHTLFGMRTVPLSGQAASTGVGHYQNTQLDIKQVTRGEVIQVNVKYNINGVVQDVLYQRAKPGQYVAALPGYFDYLVTVGSEPAEFDDISMNLVELGFYANDIAQFKGGQKPVVGPAQAPYVFRDGKLMPAFGMPSTLPPARLIPPMDANEGENLVNVYRGLNTDSLASVARSFVNQAEDLVAGRLNYPTFGHGGLSGRVAPIEMGGLSTVQKKRLAKEFVEHLERGESVQAVVSQLMDLGKEGSEVFASMKPYLEEDTQIQMKETFVRSLSGALEKNGNLNGFNLSDLRSIHLGLLNKALEASGQRGKILGETPVEVSLPGLTNNVDNTLTFSNHGRIDLSLEVKRPDGWKNVGVTNVREGRPGSIFIPAHSFVEEAGEPTLVRLVRVNNGSALASTVGIKISSGRPKAIPPSAEDTLKEIIKFNPVAPKIGTSGVRADVLDLRDIQIYAVALAHIRYLRGKGLLGSGHIPIGIDLRPTSPRINQAVAMALKNEGFGSDYIGKISSPALTLYNLMRRVAGVEATGSHIPAYRNGFKFNRKDGELRPEDNDAINKLVASVLEELLAQKAQSSLFDEYGFFKKNVVLPVLSDADVQIGWGPYKGRFEEALRRDTLHRNGKPLQVVFYQHSAVGREAVPEILENAGAVVHKVGASEKFVPIDTEAINDEHLAMLLAFAEDQWKKTGPVDAVVSTDGDSDRPLVVGVEKKGFVQRISDLLVGVVERVGQILFRGDQAEARRQWAFRKSFLNVEFIPGELLGAMAAEYMGADFFATPVSSHPGLESFFAGLSQKRHESIDLVRTKIGSAQVVEAMETAERAGKKKIMGAEANGGTLQQSPMPSPETNSIVEPLATRDATLPIVAVLAIAAREGATVVGAVKSRFKGYKGATMIDIEESAVGVTKGKIDRYFATHVPGAVELLFAQDGSVAIKDSEKSDANTLTTWNAGDERAIAWTQKKVFLEKLFAKAGYTGGIAKINVKDGIQVHFNNGEIGHFRPSGNASQLRLYVYTPASKARKDKILKVADASLLNEFKGFIDEQAGKAKPFSVARVGVKMMLSVVAATAAYALGASLTLMVLPMAVAVFYVGFWAFSFTHLLDSNITQFINAGEGVLGEIMKNPNELSRVAQQLQRFGFASKTVDGKLTLTIGGQPVTVQIGYPKGGVSWLAETTAKKDITLRPGIPGWLLPFVLRTEIYRVSFFQGALVDVRLLPGLRRSSATTRGPPVETEAVAVDSATNRENHLATLRGIAGENKGPVNVIAIVNGGDGVFVGDSLSGQREELFRADGKTTVMSFEEEPSRGQFFGLLAAIRQWKQQNGELNRDHVSAGIMMPGKGTRMSPLTQWAFGIKPFIPMLIRATKGGPWLSAAAASIFSWTLVTSRLEALGFRGIAWKWGDEPQIASRLMESFEADLSNTDAIRVGQATAIPLDIGEKLRNADHNTDGTFTDPELARLDDLARNKEWLVVDRKTNRLLLDLRRRPLQQLIALRDQLEAEREPGSIELLTHMGSPAFSYAFIDAADRVYDSEVSDTSKKMDVDGFLFAALTMPKELWDNDVKNGIIAFGKKTAEENASEAQAYYQKAQQLKAQMNAARGRAAGAELDLRVLNMGAAPYWGDIGQLAKARDSVSVVNDRESPNGDFARRLAMIDDVAPDEFGNIVVGNSQYPKDGSVKNSVIIDSLITRGAIDGAVIVNSQLGVAQIRAGSVVFDSTVGNLTMGSKSYAHGVMAGMDEPIVIDPNYVQTTIPKNPSASVPVFEQWRADMAVDVGKEVNYNQAKFGNPESFNAKAKTMRARDPQNSVSQIQAWIVDYRRRLADQIKRDTVTGIVEDAVPGVRTAVEAKVADSRDVMPAVEVLSLAVGKQVTSEPIASVSLSGLMVALMKTPAAGVSSAELGRDWLAMSPRRMIAWLGYATPAERLAGLGALRETPAKAEAVLGVIMMDASAAHSVERSYKTGQKIDDAAMRQEMQDLAQLGFWFGLSIGQAQAVMDRTYNLQRTLADEVRGERKKVQLESVARLGANGWQTLRQKGVALVLALRRMVLARNIAQTDAPIFVLPIVNGPNGVEWQSGVDEKTQEQIIRSVNEVKEGSRELKTVIALDGSLTKSDIATFVSGESRRLDVDLNLLNVVGNEAQGIHGEEGTVNVPAVIKYLAENGRTTREAMSVSDWLLRFNPVVYANEVSALDLGDFRNIVKVMLILAGEIKPLDLGKYDNKVERYLKAQA